MLPGRAAHDPTSAARPAIVAVAVIVVMLAVIVGGVVAVGRGALASWAPAPPAASATASVSSSASSAGDTVVVRPGDTLWSIAGRLQPTGDVRPLVDRLVASHGSPVVVPGDRVPVPR